MRLSQTFLRSKHHAKAPQNENNVPFKELKPLILKNKVTGSIKNTTENTCLFEMSLLFKCWADNEFRDNSCSQYVQQVQKCYKNYIISARQQKDLQKADVPTPGSKHLTSKQYTFLLQQYPTV